LNFCDEVDGGAGGRIVVTIVIESNNQFLLFQITLACLVFLDFPGYTMVSRLLQYNPVQMRIG
jgi:hypothetical protein